jgi:peptide deformylase
MALNIVLYPARVLSRAARRVNPGDLELNQLFEEMVEAMQTFVGVGLAAPQVGKSIRFMIAENRATGEIRPYVNPQIVEFSSDKDVGPEGCLSFPGLVGDVVRSKSITVRYQDLDFNTIEEEASGFYARVLQHEIDHLNGVLLIDRAVDGLYEVRPEDENEDGEGEGEEARAYCGPLELPPSETKA